MTSKELTSSTDNLRSVIQNIKHLHPEVPGPLPEWPGFLHSTLVIKFLSESNKVDLTSTLININFAGLDTDGPFSVVDFVSDEEQDDNWSSKVRLKEDLRIRFSANGEQSDVELGDEAKNVQAKTDP